MFVYNNILNSLFCFCCFQINYVLIIFFLNCHTYKYLMSRYFHNINRERNFSNDLILTVFYQIHPIISVESFYFLLTRKIHLLSMKTLFCYKILQKKILSIFAYVSVLSMLCMSVWCFIINFSFI